MVVFANLDKEAELIDIWQKCFGDSKEYISMFLKNNISRIKIPAYELNGKIVSATYLLPITFCDGKGEEIPCYYLYAAATLPAYQGNGYFAATLQYVQNYFSEPIILVPAEESLEKYYEKLGLFNWLEGNTVHDRLCEKKENLSVKEIDASKYYLLREQMLQGKPHMKWNQECMDYICMENTYCGGKQVTFKAEGNNYIAMYRKNGEELCCVEILPQENLKAAVQVLLEETGCSHAVTCVQPHTMATKQLKKYETAYFNLTMG